MSTLLHLSWVIFFALSEISDCYLINLSYNGSHFLADNEENLSGATDSLLQQHPYSPTYFLSFLSKACFKDSIKLVEWDTDFFANALEGKRT